MSFLTQDEPADSAPAEEPAPESSPGPAIQPAGEDLGSSEPAPSAASPEQTESDLKDSGTDVIAPEPPASDMTISIHDHKVEVSGDPPSVDPVNTVGGISDEELERMRRIVAEETASCAATTPRPFQSLDLESVLVLYNQLRAELGSR